MLRPALLVLVLACALTAVPASAGDPALLDGRTYAITVLDPVSKKSYPDTLYFEGGKLGTKASRPWGFQDAAYRAEKDGDTIRFDAIASSSREGRNEWTGTVRSDRVSGTLVWTKGKKIRVEYTFESKATGEPRPE